MNMIIFYNGDWKELHVDSYLQFKVPVQWRRKSFTHFTPKEVTEVQMHKRWPHEPYPPENGTLVGPETAAGSWQAPLLFSRWEPAPIEGAPLANAIYRIVEPPRQVQLRGSVRAWDRIHAELYRRGGL